MGMIIKGRNKLEEKMELEKKTTYYVNGNKKQEYWINKNGKLEGECKTWHENGNKWVERNYKNGKLEGEYKAWYPNGNKGIEANCKKGKEEGITKQWEEKGRLELWEYIIKRRTWIKIKENYKKYKTLEKLITKRKRKKRYQTIKRLRTKIDGIQGDILVFNLIVEYVGKEIIEEAIEK